MSTPGAAVVPQSSKRAMTPVHLRGHASTGNYRQLQLLDIATAFNPGTYASAASIDNKRAAKRSKTSHPYGEGPSATGKTMDDESLNEVVNETVKRKVAEAIAKEKNDMNENSISIAFMLEQHHKLFTRGPINRLEEQMARKQAAMMRMLNETLFKQDRVIQKLGDFVGAVRQQNGQRSIENSCAEMVSMMKSQKEVMERVSKPAGEKTEEDEVRRRILLHT